MSIEAMKQALEALEQSKTLAPFGAEGVVYWEGVKIHEAAKAALRQAIEQAEQAQPVAHTLNCVCGATWDIKADGSEEMVHTPDTTPPQRQPLTDEELWKFWWARPEVPDGEDDSMEAEFVAAVRRVLAAHGIRSDDAA